MIDLSLSQEIYAERLTSGVNGEENLVIFVKSIYGFVILQISIFMPREMLDGKNLLFMKGVKKI